ncbi:MAG: substrate-binding domain-containing protein [Bacteroidales bacterium]|nr:substrate-binding domain-containing protein [Bacteroidales bacterium]
MDEKKDIKISDIARMANVSAGTVDRVLHNRGNVSQKKREQIEKVLAEINYKPNLLARSLASKKTYKFITLTPEYNSGEYWENVIRGTEKAQEELNAFNITLEHRFFNQYDKNSFSQQIEKISTVDFDGIVIAALFENLTIEFSKMLDNRNIPYVYIDSDIKNQNNLAYYGVNSYESGKIAAIMALHGKERKNNISTILYKTKSGILSVQNTWREKGFKDVLDHEKFKGEVHPLLFDYKSPEENKKKLNELLNKIDIDHIIVFNSRIHEVVDMLPADKKNKIHCIGYDLTDKNKKCLENGDIDFLLGQREDMQGYNAIKALGSNLIFASKVAKTNYMPIDILIKENVGFYWNFKF